MSYRVAVLCRPPLTAGFRLAGLEVTAAADAAAAGTALAAFGKQNDLGIVLIEQELMDALPDERRRARARAEFPILVPFPGRMWAEQPSAAEAYIAEILRQAIGYRVRLR